MNLKGGDFGKFSLPAHYGDVAVVFKPEVKQRMIWSYTDSLGTDKSRRRLRRPPMTAQYETPEANRKACYGYCEAQIWGALDLTDVAYLMIKEGDKVPESLKKLGVPVYFYRPEPNPEHAAGFTRLEQAVAGNPARIKRPDVLTLSEIEKAKNEPAVRDIPKPFPNPIKSILVSKEQSILSESELLERISSPESTPADRESDSAFDPKEQLVAELATRPKTPAVIRKLKELMTDSSVHIRSQAAYGLSELPWSEFKRIALHCLKDSSEVVKLECLALVADHLTDDADIAKAIRELEAAEGDSKLKDWIKVLQAKRLCDSMASER
ncbi:MAG: hypothetical protein NDJ89_05695 [Oligoflexia bacterium]|nr:hypothetical protein [Oligoflexia bacterium]